MYLQLWVEKNQKPPRDDPSQLQEHENDQPEEQVGRRVRIPEDRIDSMHSEGPAGGYLGAEEEEAALTSYSRACNKTKPCDNDVGKGYAFVAETKTRETTQHATERTEEMRQRRSFEIIK